MNNLRLVSDWYPDINTCRLDLFALNSDFVYLFSELGRDHPHPKHIARIWDRKEIEKNYPDEFKNHIDDIKNIKLLRQSCLKTNTIFNGKPSSDGNSSSIREISRLIKTNTEYWLKNKKFILDTRSINEGSCYDFAKEIENGINSVFGTDFVKICETKSIYENDQIIENFYHAWVEFNDIAFDAEAPEGCHPNSLPFFKRNSYSIFNLLETDQSMELF